jgi:hypothetical protein
MAVDEIGGKQKKPRNLTADEKVQGWKITPKDKIPKGLKEEVEIKSFSEFEESVEIKEKELATPAFNDLANELMGYVDEDERVIKKLHKPLVKKLAKDMEAGKYNHGKATKEWARVVEKALNMNSSFKKQVV